MICGARGPSPGPRSARATLSPLPRGEGSDRARGLIVLQHERALLRCVSCFTLDSANAFYRDAVTERSVMAVGGRLPPPLLGVSSLDLAPLAFAGGAFFIASGSPSRAGLCKKNAPAEAGATWHVVTMRPQSRRLGASGTFFQWVRLSAMILVD